MRPSSRQRGRCAGCLPKMSSIFTWRRNTTQNAGSHAATTNIPTVSMMTPKPILGDDSTTSTTSSALPGTAAAAAINNTDTTSPNGYVNTGLQRWNALRSEWTSDPIPTRRRHLSDSQEDYVYDELMRAEHRPFPKHTSLSVVIRILPEIWERERRALIMSAPKR